MRLFLIVGFLLVSSLGYSQTIINVFEQTGDPESTTIHVEPVAHTNEAASFLIWVDEHVREHHHAEHTEHVYIIEGTGDMLVGDSIYAVKKGDLIVIPPGTPHAVMTTSEEPLKVVSVQSPDFVGADRVFTNGKTWATYLETRK